MVIRAPIPVNTSATLITESIRLHCMKIRMKNWSVSLMEKRIPILKLISWKRLERWTVPMAPFILWKANSMAFTSILQPVKMER